MKLFIFLFALLPLRSLSHPGIGIVKDSKGNIYYTDLERVWKITNGHKTVVVPNMHTHELWIDKNDNLYGENQIYMDEGTNRFDHFLWVLKPDGTLDTVVKRTRAFVRIDYSLNRDADGNEYYVKQFVSEPDSNHIYKRAPGGKEEVFAKANAKGLNWLYPMKDGSVLYVSGNNIYIARKGETARIFARNIGKPDPNFSFMKSPVVYGIFEDKAGDVYVAVYSDQAIKKISRDGSVTEIFRSAENWGPNNGVFDNEGNLWVLETSDKNEVRVTKTDQSKALSTPDENQSNTWLWLFISAAVSILLIIAFVFQNLTAKTERRKGAQGKSLRVP